MTRNEIIQEINELLDVGKHIGIEVGIYLYTNYPKLVKEKPEGLTINISKLSDEILKNILEIAKKANTTEIPFYLTL